VQFDQDFGQFIGWLNEKFQQAILWFHRHNFNQDVSLLKGALEKGFEPANSWLHLIAVFFAFVSDVLKPLTPRFTKRLAIGGFTLSVPPFLGVEFGFVPEELASALIVFCLSVAVLSSVMLFLQRGHEHGALAELVPGVERLQERLGIIETKIDEVKQDTAALRMGQLSEFRQTIYRAAYAYDEHMQEVSRCIEQSDFEGGRVAMLQAARSQGEIITAYKLNKHLFGERAIAEIEREIAAAESNDEGALLHLITAIQLINTHSEAVHASLDKM
jgi:hypothetical protein